MDRGKKIIRVSLFGIGVNLVLVAFKAAVGAVTGSIAIIMDAVNNLSDAMSSIVTIVGAALAGKAPDKKHPYGYGQIEYVSSVAVAAIILVTGLTSFQSSLGKIMHPEEASYAPAPLLIIAVAVVVKVLAGRYVKAQGEKCHSQALIASGSDALMDAIVSASTLVAAGVSIFFHVSIEGWLGAAISVLILKTGLDVLMESLNGIIGSRVESSLSLELKERICGYPQVRGAYDLILHRYGPERIIGSVHVEVDDQMTAREIHALTRAISEDIYAGYGIIMTIGIYASNTGDEKSREMKDFLLRLAEGKKEILQVHGFYVDEEKRQASFDLIMDFKTEDREGLRDEVVARMREAYPEYEFSAILDNDFSE